MSENLADRLDAVERALTDDETDLAAVRERAALSAEVDRLETRVEELEAQVEELNAALEAVRGYTGNVRAVNREVERRASAALAKAEALESTVDGVSGNEVSGGSWEHRSDGVSGNEVSGGSSEHRSDGVSGGADGGRPTGATLDREPDGSDPVVERTSAGGPDTDGVRVDGSRTGGTWTDENWTDGVRTSGRQDDAASPGRNRTDAGTVVNDDSGGAATVRNLDRPGGRPPRGAAGREDRPDATGRDGQPGTGEHGSRRRAAAAEHRPTAIKDPSGGSEESDGESGTEQFIERVRDAL